MKKIALSFFLFVLLGFLGQAVYGCSCLVESKEINYKRWLKGFDGAAFEGRVVKIETDTEKSESRVTFKVRSYWRGVEGREAVIFTSSDSGLCGVDYVEGKEYTVFANSSGDKLRTDLCSDMAYAQYREGFLRALGEAKRPSDPDGPPPQRFDEFGDVNCEVELARLDAFANELQQDPESYGYVIVYGGRTGKRNEAKARLARISYYLQENRGFSRFGLVPIDGGFRESFTVELWIASPDGLHPRVAPTVRANDVRRKGKAKVRGYNCADEMGI